MNRFIKNLKMLLNKDMTSFLNKHKISLIASVVLILLVCIGLYVSYAFYQAIDTTPIIGGSTGKIADLDVRIMAEERDTNGNGLNSYGLYPYIPQAGYQYNASKSYCTNGSTINYHADTYSADIASSGHDVCYLYFDSTASLDLTLNVYVQDVNDAGEGIADSYTKLETTTLPTIGYKLHETENTNDKYNPKCDNGSTVSYSADENLFTVEANQKDVCTVYMDAIDVDIAMKLYVQSKKGSSTYYEAKTVPTDAYYELNTSESACTKPESNTLSMKNQRVVISAKTRTSCVAYLDVASGPILESMKTEVTGQSVKITLKNSNVGVTPTKYYYSKDNGATYTSSTSNTYTFTGLSPVTDFTFKAYSVDASGNESSILTTTATTGYVYNGIFDYKNSAQTKTIEVTGYYQLEVWGAEGGYRSSQTYSGKGGYSTGIVHLNEGDIIYVYTGGFPGSGTSGCGSTICAGGFNGGGYRYKYYGGGGATDIRINSDSLYARVIVAGGGGSDGATAKKGMYGGGTAGGSSTESYSGVSNYGGKGGTQTYSGYSASYTITSQTTTGLNSNTLANYAGGFGFGGGGVYLSSGYGGAGGGGWYGGSGNVPDSSSDDDRGGGGGSGYVYTSSTAANYPSGCLLDSNYYLTSATTTAGDQSFLSPTGVSETGHTGNGYAKVTYVGKELP